MNKSKCGISVDAEDVDLFDSKSSDSDEKSVEGEQIDETFAKVYIAFT